jgi:hypothetical protein
VNRSRGKMVIHVLDLSHLLGIEEYTRSRRTILPEKKLIFLENKSEKKNGKQSNKKI